MDQQGWVRVNVPDLQQLRFAVVAADCGSMRQAAELLSIRHSTLSRSIRQFEHRIGITVFERSSSGLKPTLSGDRALRMARLILEQVDMLVAAARSAGQDAAGRLSIGFCTDTSAGNLRATLSEFRRQHPRIELATVERRQAQLTASLQGGTLDILIVPEEVPLPDHCVHPLWSERILLALSDKHTLAARPAVHWTDLRNERLLLSRQDPARKFEELMISRLVCPEDRPLIDRHDVSRGTIKSLISMKLGIGLVLESDTGAAFSGVVYRELRDGAGPARIDFSAHWRKDNDNPALNSLIALLRERYPLTMTCD